MFLTSNQSLIIQLTTPVVSAIEVVIDYADHTNRIPVAGNLNISVTGSSTTIISGMARQIKNITIFNPNSSSVEITVIQNYNTSQVIRKVVTLEQNKTLQYSDHKGWSI